MATEVAIIQLVTALVEIVVPRILDRVLAHQQANPGAPLPSAADVAAQLNVRELAILAQGQAWKAAHPDSTTAR